MTLSAPVPKITTAATVAGSSAMTTSKHHAAAEIRGMNMQGAFDTISLSISLSPFFFGQSGLVFSDRSS